MPKQKVRKAVLTDAGYATRFLPITKTLPKSMLPIWDKPITQFVVEECMAAGITEIIMVATEEGKPFYEDYFHNSVQHIYEMLQKQNKESRFKKVRDVFSLPNVVVITQDRNLPYGNGTPILCAKPYVGNDPFIAIFTDDLVFGQSRAQELLKAFEESDDNVKAIVPVKEIPGVDVTKYGMVRLKQGSENLLDGIVEKPAKGKSPSELVSFSGYVLTPEIFEYLEPKKENLGKDSELWLVDAIERMTKDYDVLIHRISGNWQTTGDPVNYLKTVLEYTLEYEQESKEEIVKFLMEKLDNMGACDEEGCCCGGNCGCKDQ